jgi:hypothetical protein
LQIEAAERKTGLHHRAQRGLKLSAAGVRKKRGFPDRDLFWAAPGNIRCGFVFDFCERGTSERNNQKQNTVALSARNGGELKLKTE